VQGGRKLDNWVRAGCVATKALNIRCSRGSPITTLARISFPLRAMIESTVGSDSHSMAMSVTGCQELSHLNG
jgi:hypothetical protein